jgi:hypothetical protein
MPAQLESPPRSAPHLTWSQESRLRALDAIAFWDGRVNRADLIRRFDISVPQATNDFRRYLELAPGNLRYDTREKAYLTEPDFKPLFGTPNAEAWLQSGKIALAQVMPVEIAPLPPRRINAWLLRRILAAKRAREALHVLYQPMDEPDPSWRWISPLALGSDGFRWHLRAYNHDAGRFDDMLFPRFVEIAETRPEPHLPTDLDWNRYVTVRICPARRLSPSQRAVVASDYGMDGEEGIVKVRAALLFLLLQRLGTDRPGALVEIKNNREVTTELRRLADRHRITGASTPAE